MPQQSCVKKSARCFFCNSSINRSAIPIQSERNHNTTTPQETTEQNQQNQTPMSSLVKRSPWQQNLLATNAQGTAIRQQIQASTELHSEQNGERKQENAITHQKLSKIQEAQELAAADRKAAAEDRERTAEDLKQLKGQLHTAIAVLTSSRKPANQDRINQGDLPSRALTFGSDGEVVAVTIADDASTLTSEDAEDADSKVASLKLELKDEREKVRALTTPSGQVGLSEIPPSVTNLTGRARQAETKHVGEKTKRRQQDEQAKAMRTKRYVPAPTRRSTRSTRSSLAEK